MSPFRITFDSLHAELFSPRRSKWIRIPITGLERNPNWECVHLHGRLVIAFGDRHVPELGHNDEDDVCFDAWLVELVAARDALVADGASHTYVDCEQGQPAFRFARHGESMLFSIVESPIGEGGANADWQEVETSVVAFSEEVTRFVAELERVTRAALPTKWHTWWPLTRDHAF